MIYVSEHIVPYWRKIIPNIDISDSAFSFLKSKAVPLEDTAATVLDRLIADYLSASAKPQASEKEGLHFDLSSVPSVKFTTVTLAKVAGENASQNSWNHILADVIKACVLKGANSEQVIRVMQANIKNGKHSDNGYRFVPKANFSFQGLEANRAYKNIVALAKSFEITLEIQLLWQNKEESALPNQSGTIVYP